MFPTPTGRQTYEKHYIFKKLCRRGVARGDFSHFQYLATVGPLPIAGTKNGLMTKAMTFVVWVDDVRRACTSGP